MKKLCRYCKTKFAPVRPMQAVCGPFCAIQITAKKNAQVKKAAVALDKKETKQKLIKLKTRSQWVKEAQAAFNAWVRKRDMVAGFACISSGRVLDWTGNQTDAGHYRSTGAAKHLRFNPDNCHAQSKHDNRYLAGNAVDYRINLIKRIGLERVEALEADQSIKKYTIDDLKGIILEYRTKVKHIESEK